MRSYSSFLVRCWLIRDDSQAERSVFHVEHIQTGEQRRLTSLAEVSDWMRSSLARASSARDGDQPDQEPFAKEG